MNSLAAISRFQLADLNAKWRNYRPLHQLIQGEPHAGSAASRPEGLACLEWMSEHGADPEPPGAWPSAGALLTAPFGGQPEHVKRPRKAGARIDGFTAAALGEQKVMEKVLREQPDFPRE